METSFLGDIEGGQSPIMIGQKLSCCDGETLKFRYGPMLILIKFICFVVNVISVLINMCLLL
jgi:hypothetical protein